MMMAWIMEISSYYMAAFAFVLSFLNNEDTATKLPTRTLAAGFRLRNDPKTTKTKQCRFRKHYMLPRCLFLPHPCRKARDAKAIRSLFWGFLFPTIISEQGLIMACFSIHRLDIDGVDHLDLVPVSLMVPEFSHWRDRGVIGYTWK